MKKQLTAIFLVFALLLTMAALLLNKLLKDLR